jgi:hypothetical protein
MQRATLIVNTRSRSGENVFFRGTRSAQGRVGARRAGGPGTAHGILPGATTYGHALRPSTCDAPLIEVEEDIRLLTDPIRHPRGTSAAPGV